MSDFYNEIMTQPDMLRNLVTEYEKSAFRPLEKAAEAILGAKTVIFSGMGTSYYAPGCILKEIREYKTAFCVEAFEISNGGEGVIDDGDVLVLLSQSGESIEVVKALKNCKKKVTVIGITNDENSTLAKMSDVVLLLYAGPEKSITNKTFSNTMAVLYMLLCSIRKGDMSSLCISLKDSADRMDEIIGSRQDEIKAIATRLAPADHLHFIGRKGASLTIARQSGLIFMEGAASAARSFSTGEFRHGPIEICSSSHRAVIYHSNDDEYDIMSELEQQISEAGSTVFVVTNAKPGTGDTFFIDAADPIQYSLVAAVFMELLLVFTAELRGRVAGVFNITHKICVAE